MTVDEKTIAYERNTIVKIIANIDLAISANGISQKEAARLWAKKGYFHVRLGENFQARLAFKQALELDPENSWARNSLKKIR